MFEQVDQQIKQLTHDLSILEQIQTHEPIGLQELATRTGQSKLTVEASLRRLESAGLIEPTDNGATTTNRTSMECARIDTQLTQIQTRLQNLKY